MRLSKTDERASEPSRRTTLKALDDVMMRFGLITRRKVQQYIMQSRVSNGIALFYQILFCGQKNGFVARKEKKSVSVIESHPDTIAADAPYAHSTVLHNFAPFTITIRIHKCLLFCYKAMTVSITRLNWHERGDDGVMRHQTQDRLSSAD